MPGLFEDHEEQKYPSWLRYLGIIYGVVLLWATLSLPPTGYDFDSLLIVLLLWMPVFFGVFYIVEKPGIIAEHKKAMRILITVFTIIAIIWGILVSYAFME